MTAKPRSLTLGRMLPFVLLLQVLKRVGLAKPLLSRAFKNATSREKKLQAFAGYSATEHDVFVATFSKSGTNWMMQIAQQVAYRGESEFVHVHDVVPWPDSIVGDAVPLSDTTSRDQSPTGLRVIKTHLEAEFIPYDEKAVYLTVLRDPKEVFVSSYHFLGGVFGVLPEVTLHDWFDVFMQPGALGRMWAEHTASFWAWRDRPNVLVLDFGEVKRDSRGCIVRVAKVMGVELTAAELDRVVERSSFEYMRAHEAQFAPPKPPFTKEGDRPRMVRSGKTGDSGDSLTPAQQAAIDRMCQEELRDLGSDYPYDF
jgi:hypothetical protein